MEKLRLRDKIQTVPRKTLLIVAGSILTLVVLISCIVLSIEQTAESHARHFEKDVDAYVKKLDKTKNKFKDLSSTASTPPRLKTVPLGSLSAAYKKAEAKQAVLATYQDELFTPLTKYDKTNNLNNNLLKAERSFDDTFDEKIGEAADAVIDARYDNDFDEYKYAAQTYLEKKVSLHKQYRQTIDKIDASPYGSRVKQFYIHQIDNGIKKAEATLSRVKVASSFGLIRYELYLDKINDALPSQSVGYPLYAANVMYVYPYLVTTPAMAALQKNLGTISDQSVPEARASAYRSLYGAVAAHNVPSVNDTELNTQRKLGTASFALHRLNSLLTNDKDLPQTTRDMALKDTKAARTAFSSIGFGNDQTELPAGSARLIEYTKVLSDISDYNGYSDSRANYRAVLTGDPKITGSEFSADQGWAIIKATDSLLPGGYFAEDAAAYKKAMHKCTGARLVYQKKSDEVMQQKIIVNKNIAGLSKKLEDIAKVQTPTDAQIKQLAQWQKDIKNANDKVTKLDNSLEAEDKTQNTVLDTCLPAAEKALTSFKAKSDDHQAHLNYIHKTVRTISE